MKCLKKDSIACILQCLKQATSAEENIHFKGGSTCNDIKIFLYRRQTVQDVHKLVKKKVQRLLVQFIIGSFICTKSIKVENLYIYNIIPNLKLALTE